MEKSQSNFVFSFEGEQHGIEVNDLVSVLDSLNKLVANTTEACFPDVKTRFKIEATNQGSFHIDLAVMAVAVASLFSPSNISIAKSIIDTLKSFFELKKFIGNKPPEKVTKKKDKIEVTNSEGKKEKFPSKVDIYFHNPVFDNSIINITHAGERNEDVTGFSIIENDKRVVSVSREEFEKMKIPVVTPPEYPTKLYPSTDVLQVKQSTLLGDAQWTFVKDRTIKARIKDEEWLEDYQCGKYPMVPLTEMQVELTTLLKMDNYGVPIQDSAEYEITKVIKVIYPDSFIQTQLEEIIK